MKALKKIRLILIVILLIPITAILITPTVIISLFINALLVLYEVAISDSDDLSFSLKELVRSVRVTIKSAYDLFTF